MAELTDQRLVGPRAPAASGDDPGPSAEPEKVMTLVEHLSELRRRIFISLFAIAAGSVVGFLLAPRVIALLAEPIPGPIFFTQPGGALFLQLKLAVMMGVALAMPVILYHFWAFVSPGLMPNERRAARPWIPFALILLVAGVLTAYSILPFTVTFLIGFQIEGQLEPLITADHYFGFVLMLFLAFAAVLQFPIVLLILAKAGILGAQKLRAWRRYALLVLYVVAVLVTPADPFSAIIMTAIMYPLYELTILLVARGARRSEPADG
ncbi:MAG TPA: twin-arginine translocase subunit TatC [Candidatus Limnocylindria bacterium]|nr:twin-arginine translocase subunit TatC [Candidatus Limnocylindria bacterium]